MATLSSASRLAARRGLRGGAVAPAFFPSLRCRGLHRGASDDDEGAASGLVDGRGHLRFDTLHELVSRAATAYSDNPLFGTYRASSRDDPDDGDPDDGGGPGFSWTTYGDFARDVARCRTVLRNDLGVEPHSKVGIVSDNRREWATVAAATYSLNATLVPLYEAQRSDDWTHVLNDAGCRTLLCGTEGAYLRAKRESLPECPSVVEAACFDAPEGEPHSFKGMMARAAEEMGGDGGEGGAGVVAPSEDDLANLIYTSGTTGKPKGVELLHSNQVSNIKAARDMGALPSDFPLPTDRSLAFLPWAHSYGQTCELWAMASRGASVGICRGVPHILEDLSLAKPTLLYAVPTLYKKVRDGVIGTMRDGGAMRTALVRAALRSGRAEAARRNANDDGDGAGGGGGGGLLEGMTHRALDGLVLSKIRERFGGNLRAGFVAGAACPKEIVEFMDAIGIPICEGYGLTETSPVIALNLLSERKAGSVGRVLKGVKVWIVDSEGKALGPDQEGEICCSGPNVMKGYHNNKTATDEVITLAPDGKSKLFHTGDLGRLGADGFLSVTGRLKEQYKLENGKYVCPTPIEEAIGMSRFVSQVVVCGANRPHNVALVVPDWSAVRSELGLPEGVDEEELANDARAKGLIGAEIKLNCYGVKKFEVPAAFLMVSPFTAANNMVTPKMSIRRHVVIKTYEDMISDLYDGSTHCGGYLRKQDGHEAA